MDIYARSRLTCSRRCRAPGHVFQRPKRGGSAQSGGRGPFEIRQALGGDLLKSRQRQSGRGAKRSPKGARPHREWRPRAWAALLFKFLCQKSAGCRASANGQPSHSFCPPKSAAGFHLKNSARPPSEAEGGGWVKSYLLFSTTYFFLYNM